MTTKPTRRNPQDLNRRSPEAAPKTHPDPRWSLERKRDYGKHLVAGFKDLKKFENVFITLLHVTAFYDDAVAPFSETGGYGIKPTEMGLSTDDLVAAKDEFIALWHAYVKAVWPDHPQTPGSTPGPKPEKHSPYDKPFHNPYSGDDAWVNPQDRLKKSSKT